MEKYKLLRRWSDVQGSYWYGFFKNGVGTAEGNWSFIASGDIEWACNMADHYRIEIPQVNDDAWQAGGD